ncbi:arsenic resistance N-acetyltransferase ArsN2 [Paraflavisolibacter sp. H34]|uniref:arsenic resistance N-acetyltransferase ArsN2 n=1 Tax=Huijunlia imazamoxiresistens TaxID=3127457 RepID=UPI00301B1A65
MAIYPVTQNNFSKALELLKKNGLPTEDIRDTTKLFVLYDEHELKGVAGLELMNRHGLVRSLCVPEEQRAEGAGTELVNFLEEYARNAGVQTLYLLTTTAAEFFSKRAYQAISREEVPASIQQTSEFSALCPSSATVMKKVIG